MCRECTESMKTPKIDNMIIKLREEINNDGIKENGWNVWSRKINAEKEKVDNAIEEKTKTAKPNEKSNETVCCRYNLKISEKDIPSVQCSTSITDDIMNLWMEHLKMKYNYNESMLFIPPSVAQILKVGKSKLYRTTPTSLEVWWKSTIHSGIAGKWLILSLEISFTYIN